MWLLFPILIAPLLYYLVWNNYLDFGAGEKDMIVPILWGYWSILFAISGFFIRGKKLSTIKWLGKTCFISILVVIISLITLFFLRLYT